MNGECEYDVFSFPINFISEMYWNSKKKVKVQFTILNSRKVYSGLDHCSIFAFLLKKFTCRKCQNSEYGILHDITVHFLS